MYRKCLKFKFVFLIFSLIVLLTPTLSYGSSHLKGWTHYGIRPLGMGNAFVAVANDYNAIFYNPAGIGSYQKKFGLQLINLNLAVTKSVISIIKDFKDGLKENEKYDIMHQELSPPEVREEFDSLPEEYKDMIKEKLNGEASDELFIILKHLDESVMVNISSTPYLYFSNFEIAAGIDAGASLKISMTEALVPAVDLTGGYRVMVPVGFATEFLDGKIRAGASLKFLRQFIIDAHLDGTEINDINEDKLEDDFTASKGYGFGADVGVLISQPESKFKPTLGVSLANIGSPKGLEESLNTGVSFQLYKGDVITLIAASDVHSINQNIEFSKKFGAGLECGIYSFLKLQTGIYHKALTFGINLDFLLLNLRAATYVEDVGKGYGSSNNRVFMAEIKLLI